MKKITFTVTPDNNINDYWIAVDNEDIKLINGEGSISLAADRNYNLIWWMTGTGNAVVEIIGRDTEDNEIVKVKSSIPVGEGKGSGFKYFKVN